LKVCCSINELVGRSHDTNRPPTRSPHRMINDNARYDPRIRHRHASSTKAKRMKFLAATLTLTGMASATTPVALAATTALMMDETGNGDPFLFTSPSALGYTGLMPAEMNAVLSGYFNGDTEVSVSTPEELSPLYGPDTLDQSVAIGTQDINTAIMSTPGDKVVYGVSQSAVIVSQEQKLLAAEGNPAPTDELSFVVEGDPLNPNGGLFTRFPGLLDAIEPITGIGSFSEAPATPYDTIVVDEQYDGISDFPEYPLDALADLNAVMGFMYLHPDYADSPTLGGTTQVHPDLSTLTPVGAVTNSAGGTTTYYLVPTTTLPLLMPLQQLGVPASIVTPLNTVLTPIVEAGYNRDPSQVGVATSAQLLPPASVLEADVQAEAAAVQSVLPKPASVPRHAVKQSVKSSRTNAPGRHRAAKAK
jgi:hypothetical protein